jgi:hypothetical protein
MHTHIYQSMCVCVCVHNLKLTYTSTNMLPYIYIDLYTYIHKYQYVYVYHVLNALPLSFHGHTSQYLPAFACKGNKTLTSKQKKSQLPVPKKNKKKSQLPVPVYTRYTCSSRQEFSKKKRDSPLVYSF